MATRPQRGGSISQPPFRVFSDPTLSIIYRDESANVLLLTVVPQYFHVPSGR